jgi:hypothetical protein
MVRVPINDIILARAHELIASNKPLPHNIYGSGYAQLRQIVSGKVKSVDVEWWRVINGVAKHQVDAKAERDYNKKLAKLDAMADPARNSNAHERQAAEAARVKLEAAGAPSGRMTSAPGLEAYDREQARRRAFYRAQSDELIKAMREPSKAYKGATRAAGVNTTKAKPKAARALSVNTTRKPKTGPSVNTAKATKASKTADKPRSADRHREPNRDRHPPGYMRDYMRRRRAAK